MSDTTIITPPNASYKHNDKEHDCRKRCKSIQQSFKDRIRLDESENW